ncbi:Hypothetical Protein SCAB [Streptomyces leeuwenhoekii]|uniref:Uncharacterized protein n=1 Tax=Streptomyces leeuwenhoekii TaxID=1437453 RepID=A0A0F7VNW3_STRLW|nr:Hypothetical Protein SCAB [Streptomyces leeuwenhoekii]
MPEPNGIALSDDPFLGAEQISGDLLARYEAALAQVRYNAMGDIPPSQPDRVVLTWQPDGGLAAAPVGEAAAAVLAANGFVRDEQTGIYRLTGDDSTALARAVRKTGRQLGALGVDTALQHPSGRMAPAATPPATAALPVTAAPRMSAPRVR